ncbi:MAG: response regulator [Egibacteraceae bacterium]
MAVRVLLADNQTLMRTGFRMILEAEGDIEVVGETADGFEAVKSAFELKPDVVVMDIRMSGLDGIQATHRLAGPEVEDPVHVLILTASDLDDHIYGALRAGASGFLLKSTSPDEFVHAVRVVAAGDALIAPSITRRLIREFARRPEQSMRRVPIIDLLTCREAEVLQLVARGLSNAEIANELVLSETTVKSHVGRMLSKLNLRDRVQAVVLAYEHGLVRPGAA